VSEEFGPDFITLTDEEGNEFELEHLDTLDWNGQTYMAFLPAEYEDDDPARQMEEDDMGLIILKVVEENGEEQLATLDTDEELEAVYQQFMEILFSEEEENPS
jgi:uncharacterized protein YrzB (UPF0473 family)